MKNPKPNPALVWKQIEDFVVPHLALSVVDRAVYSYLLRHTRLEGKLRLGLSISWLARGLCLSAGPARNSLRRLVVRGALRLVERSRTGHVVEVRLPSEIRIPRGQAPNSRSVPPATPAQSPSSGLEGIDFLQTRALRQTLHARERGRCFYCLRRLNKRTRCLDHVQPRVRSGGNSYRNLVSSCVDCNSCKNDTPAPDFLRSLYRTGRLTAAELTDRLRALQALAAGKLRPRMPSAGGPEGTTKQP